MFFYLSYKAAASFSLYLMIIFEMSWQNSCKLLSIPDEYPWHIQAIHHARQLFRYVKQPIAFAFFHLKYKN
jgi:hypothetical protein